MKIFGLHGDEHQKYNGKNGAIMGFDPATGRYSVKLGEVLTKKTTHLLEFLVRWNGETISRSKLYTNYRSYINARLDVKIFLGFWGKWWCSVTSPWVFKRKELQFYCWNTTMWSFTQISALVAIWRKLYAILIDKVVMMQNGGIWIQLCFHSLFHGLLPLGPFGKVIFDINI